MEIKIKYFDNELPQLKKIEEGDWIDLYAEEDVSYKKGDVFKVGLNVAMELPKGYEAHIKPRSSTVTTWRVLSATSGVVDYSYNGPDDKWFMKFYAIGDYRIEKGDRICQFRIVKKQPELSFKESDLEHNENRGGNGSTGKKRLVPKNKP